MNGQDQAAEGCPGDRPGALTRGGVVREGFQEEVMLTLRSSLISQLGWRKGFLFVQRSGMKRKEAILESSSTPIFWGWTNCRPQTLLKTTATAAPCKTLLYLHTQHGET